MTSETYEPGMVPAGYRYENGDFVPLWGKLGELLLPIRARANALDDMFIEARGNPSLSVMDDARNLACEVMRVCWITFRKSDPRMKNITLDDDRDGLFPPGDWQEIKMRPWDCYDTERYADYASRLHDLADSVSKLSPYDMTVCDLQRIGDFFRAIIESNYDGLDNA